MLKQLYFLVGHSVFKTALARYMKAFEFKNAEFSDLIHFISVASAEAGSDLNIIEWADSWVKTAGLNELSAEISYTEGFISSFKIIQTPALESHPTLRNHRIQVEFFDDNMASVQKSTIEVLPFPITEISTFNGLSASSVILNVGD